MNTDLLESAKEQLRAGRPETARSICEPLSQSPCAQAEHFYLLGLAECALGEKETGVANLARAIEGGEAPALWFYNLGVACIAASKWERAQSAFERSAALGYDHAACQAGTAHVLVETEHFEEARSLCENLIELGTEPPAVVHNLGRAYAGLGETQKAIAIWEKAIACYPRSAPLHSSLSATYNQLHEHEQALHHAEIAARSNPSCATAVGQLGAAYWILGRLEESRAAEEAAMALDPKNSEIRSSWLFGLLHADSATPERILEGHRGWADGAVAPPAAPRSARSQLRIGYIGGELYFNASYFFIAPFLLHHDRVNCEPVIYYTRPREDDCTREVRSALPNFHHVPGRDPDQLANQVRRDAIDVLVDLSGHFPFHALRTFQKRPAPLQVAFPNYPATTGLAEMDYLFTDHWVDPPEMTETHYIEKLLRISSGHLVFRPSDASPTITSLPAERNGYVTFGLFQRPSKLNARVFDVIAETLVTTPRSRLLIHFLSRDLEHPYSALRLRLTGEFGRRGVTSDRLLWSAGADHREHMEIVSQADIALDTFPYNGQTTTCDCLWMGVPSVTVEGNSHVSRTTGALLCRAGLEDWVAPTVAEYPKIAADKASRVSVLAALRTGMRARLQNSTLLDGPRLAAAMSEAYHLMWNAT